MMKNRLLKVATLILCLSATALYGQPLKTLVLQKKACFENTYGTDAFFMLIPRNWDFKLNALIGAGPVLPFAFTAETTSKDKKTGIIFAETGFRFAWYRSSGSYMDQLQSSYFNENRGKLHNCSVIQPILSPRQFYDQYIHPEFERKCPGFVVRELGINQELTEKTFQMSMQDPQISMLVSMGSQFQIEVIQVKGEYSLGDFSMELFWTGVMEYLTNPNNQVNWGIKLSCAMMVPRGTIESWNNILSSVVNSLTINPGWMNKLNEARALQMKIYQNTQEEINQIFESVAKNRSESQEKLFNQFSSYIRGTIEIKNPFTGESLEIPNEYDKVWINSNGDIILSTDLVNPNADSQYNQNEWRQP
jgi:hypothetical protein